MLPAIDRDSRALVGRTARLESWCKSAPLTPDGYRARPRPYWRCRLAQGSPSRCSGSSLVRPRPSRDERGDGRRVPYPRGDRSDGGGRVFAPRRGPFDRATGRAGVRRPRHVTDCAIASADDTGGLFRVGYTEFSATRSQRVEPRHRACRNASTTLVSPREVDGVAAHG